MDSFKLEFLLPSRVEIRNISNTTWVALHFFLIFLYENNSDLDSISFINCAKTRVHLTNSDHIEGIDNRVFATDIMYCEENWIF